MGCHGMYKYQSHSPEETRQLGYRLGKIISEGLVIALEGDLGAGKTLFVKGLAAGLGAVEPVTSPTFTLINLYEGRLPLAHFDVYRLPTPDAIEELGYDEFFYGDGVTAVEWSDIIEDYLPEEYLLVQFQRGNEAEQGERLITFTAYGQDAERLLKELDENVSAGN